MWVALCVDIAVALSSGSSSEASRLSIKSWAAVGFIGTERPYFSILRRFPTKLMALLSQEKKFTLKTPEFLRVILEEIIEGLSGILHLLTSFFKSRHCPNRGGLNGLNQKQWVVIISVITATGGCDLEFPDLCLKRFSD